MQDSFLHFKNEQFDNQTIMASCLYSGHHYELYRQYSDSIITSHVDFAKHNRMNYYLLNDSITTHYNLIRHRTDGSWYFNGARSCLGMNKWYGIQWLFENTDAQYVVMVDFDSIFLKPGILRFNPYNSATLSPLSKTPYYDSVFFLYYCLAKGVSFDEFTKYTNIKYNSGFMIIRRDFMSKENLDEFVDFADKLFHEMELHKNGLLTQPHWIHMCDHDQSQIQSQTQNTILTPYDEVFLIYHLMKSKIRNPGLIDTGLYNVCDLGKVDDRTLHVHFCVDKEKGLETFCKPGNTKFKIPKGIQYP